MTDIESKIRIVGPTIQLRSGGYFDFESPESSLLTIGDIATALGNLCRFTGHTARFYSVAEHSVHCSRIVPPQDALAALLHDAAEAVMGDVSRPLKSLLPDYKRLEKRCEAAILARFGLPAQMPESVKRADTMMLAVEQRQAMHSTDDWPDITGTDADLEIRLMFLSPEESREAFLLRYAELTDA